MITNLDEYRQKLAEIQSNTVINKRTVLPSTEDKFVIDLDSRQITIPESFTFIATRGEHKAETIYFVVDRYFDDVDLSSKTCVVQFINQDSRGLYNEGMYAVPEFDITTLDGKIIFGWEVEHEATEYAGTISFAIRFYSIEGEYYTYNLTTLPAVSRILDTLNVTETSASSMLPSEIQIFVDRFNKIANDSVATLNTANANLEEMKAVKSSAVEELTSIKNANIQETTSIKQAASAELTGIKNSAVAEMNSIKQATLDETQAMIDEAKLNFGVFANFYMVDNVLYANTDDTYGVANITIDDDGVMNVDFTGGASDDV